MGVGTGTDATASHQSAHAVTATGWRTQPTTPWRRYAARTLDISFNGTLGYFVIMIVFYALAPATADQVFALLLGPEGPDGLLVDVFLTVILASIIGGCLIGVTGMTLGKLIFGIKVTRPDGSIPGLGAGLARDISVLVRGMGFGIPIIVLITMLVSYQRLKNLGSTSWDEGKYVVWHRPSGSGQYVLNVIGIVLILILAQVGLTQP